MFTKIAEILQIFSYFTNIFAKKWLFRIEILFFLWIKVSRQVIIPHPEDVCMYIAQLPYIFPCLHFCISLGSLPIVFPSVSFLCLSFSLFLPLPHSFSLFSSLLPAVFLYVSPHLSLCLYLALCLPLSLTVLPDPTLPLHSSHSQGYIQWAPKV